jgi:hypothetical protein
MSAKMAIILIPDGYSKAEQPAFNTECTLVCSQGDDCASSKFFGGNNYFHTDNQRGGIDRKQYFDVFRLTGDNGECYGPETLFHPDQKTTAEKASIVDRFLNQGVVPDCNFGDSQTCKVFPVIITNMSSIAGGTQSYGGEMWTLIGRLYGTSYECELLHEFGHVGITNILCDEYDADYSGPGQTCWGVTPGGGSGASGCINLINGYAGGNAAPHVPVEKWDDYVAAQPFEGGAYCNDDVWRPSEGSIMGGADVSCDFDALGIEAMNKGFEKRLGTVEATGPGLPHCTIGIDGPGIEGQTLSGMETIYCSPTDASGIAFMEFSLAEAGYRHYFLGYDEKPLDGKFAVTLDTTRYPNGSYWMLATAWDNYWNVTAYNPNFSIYNEVNNSVEGDVNGDGNIDLHDEVMALKLLSGTDPAGVRMEARLNGSESVGMQEAIYILQKIGTLR